MDPLSDVLSLLRPRCQLYAGLDAAKDWAYAFPPKDVVKFAAVIRGACWGSIEGQGKTIRLEKGDCFLLNNGSALTLSSDPSLGAIDPQAMMDVAKDGIATCNGGGEVFILSGHFTFTGLHARWLFGALPSIIHMPGATPQAEVLRWSLDHLESELRNSLHGKMLMATHLADIMLIQVLRLYLRSSHELPAGWLLALADKHVGKAVNAIHADPSHRWTLEELARTAGMSRSIFAARFRQLEGTTAIDYLTRWRMLLASDRLVGGTESVATIAFSLGYESESAFSTAFKRTMSCSPMQFRRKNRLDVSAA